MAEINYSTPNADDLERITDSDTAQNGRAWFVQVTDGNETLYARNEQEPVPAASLNKLAIVHALDLLKLDRDMMMTLPPQEERIRGTGVLQFFPDGYQVSARDAAILALAESDNVAAKLLVAHMGGAEVVNETLARSSLDLDSTRLEPATNGGFYYGETSAQEASALMQTLMGDPEWAGALHQSHVQYGIREGAGAEVERWRRYIHDGLIRALRVTEGRGNKIFYDAALPRILQYRSDMALKEGSLDDSEIGNVRHQVASLGMLTLAALSREGPVPSDVGYSPNHPAHDVHRRIGELLV